MMGLRTHFMKRFGESAVSGLYQGYMDMTYFALFPPSLRRRQLKIAIVFNYDAFRFEVWLSARNQQLQRQYWELVKDVPWPGYRIAPPAKWVDSILECDIASDFDLDDSEAMTTRIESATLAFINRMEGFLSGNRLRKERKRSVVTRAIPPNRRRSHN
ncbi:MAG TPA: hypothetical protein VNL38_01590 [Candidatus Nitrosotenuis sp.]|nr:hypothetical protein [Candidatus Nitrosotenuis sp.]